jgi:hypothetical protein
MTAEMTAEMIAESIVETTVMIVTRSDSDLDQEHRQQTCEVEDSCTSEKASTIEIAMTRVTTQEERHGSRREEEIGWSTESQKQKSCVRKMLARYQKPSMAK